MASVAGAVETLLGFRKQRVNIGYQRVLALGCHRERGLPATFASGLLTPTVARHV
jgi:hypothetical protein